MAAIITPRFRKNNAAAFKSSLTATDHYIGLGRAEAWPVETTPLTPTGSPKELIEAKTALIQMKKIRGTIDGSTGANSISRMVPRVDWREGRVFKAFSIDDITTLYSSTSNAGTDFPAYCMNAGHVYLCLTKGVSGVSQAPDHNSGIVTKTDGYRWEYLMSLVSSTTLNLQNFIAVPDSDSQTLEKLPSWYVGIGVDLYSDDLFIDTKYRQVSVVKFPNDGLPNDVNIISAKYFNMTTAVTPAVGSIITQPSNPVNPNARGVVVKVEIVTGTTRVYFSQTSTPNTDGTVTAFGSGTNGNSLTITTPGTPPIVTTASYSSIAEAYTNTVPNTPLPFGVHTKTDRVPNGEVVFLENRPFITHSAGQVEEVRVVIQF